MIVRERHHGFAPAGNSCSGVRIEIESLERFKAVAGKSHLEALHHHGVKIDKVSRHECIEDGRFQSVALSHGLQSCSFIRRVVIDVEIGVLLGSFFE